MLKYAWTNITKKKLDGVEIQKIGHIFKITQMCKATVAERELLFKIMNQTLPSALVVRLSD